MGAYWWATGRNRASIGNRGVRRADHHLQNKNWASGRDVAGPPPGPGPFALLNFGQSLRLPLVAIMTRNIATEGNWRVDDGSFFCNATLACTLSFHLKYRCWWHEHPKTFAACAAMCA